MSFYIKKLVLTGGAGGPAVLEFEKGFNLIIGPSNVGKSVVFDSINFAWGYQPKGKREHDFKLKNLNGYDHVQLEMISSNGNLIIDRDVYNDKGKYTSKVYLSGDFVQAGYYAIKGKGGVVSLNTILLRFMGIEGQSPILKNQDGGTERISWRSYMHMFFLPQTDIDRTSSVLYNPNVNGNYTKDPAILLFLLSGIDATKIVKEINKDPNKKIKNEAIIKFIEQKKKDLEEEIADRKNEKPLEKSKIPYLENELGELQEELNSALDSSEELIKRIVELNDKMSQNDILQERLSALKSQYIADIDRIEFVSQGQQAFNEAEPQDTCPYCGNHISERDSISFNESVVKNLMHIKSHLVELQKAESDIENKKCSIQQELDKLMEKRNQLTKRIENELRPNIANLNERLEEYKYEIQSDSEIHAKEEELIRYKIDISNIKREDDEEKTKYNIIDYFDEEYFSGFEKYLIEYFRRLEFPRRDTHISFDKNLLDVTFDNQDKASTMGGGFTALINAVFAYSLQQFLLDTAEYPTNILLMDSPLSQLSEKEHTLDEESVKAKFLSLLMKSEKGQCIIAEHKEKMSEEIREMCKNKTGSSDVNIIEFTGDPTYGRYGLLPNIHN